MGLRDMLKRQMRSVLQWQDDDRETLFQLLPTPGDEIKDASRLIVGPAQAACSSMKERSWTRSRNRPPFPSKRTTTLF